MEWNDASSLWNSRSRSRLTLAATLRWAKNRDSAVTAVTTSIIATSSLVRKLAKPGFGG
jgi:hypothetical protein